MAQGTSGRRRNRSGRHFARRKAAHLRKEECGTKRMELNRDTINKLRWLIVFAVVVVVTGVNYRSCWS